MVHLVRNDGVLTCKMDVIHIVASHVPYRLSHRVKVLGVRASRITEFHW